MKDEFLEELYQDEQYLADMAEEQKQYEIKMMELMEKENERHKRGGVVVNGCRNRKYRKI